MQAAAPTPGLSGRSQLCRSPCLAHRAVHYYNSVLLSQSTLHFAPIVWVYRLSNLCSGLQKTHLFCNRVLAKKRILTSNSRSRSFKVKVIQGHSFHCPVSSPHTQCNATQHNTSSQRPQQCKKACTQRRHACNQRNDCYHEHRPVLSTTLQHNKNKWRITLINVTHASLNSTTPIVK